MAVEVYYKGIQIYFSRNFGWEYYFDYGGSRYSEIYIEYSFALDAAKRKIDSLLASG